MLAFWGFPRRVPTWDPPCVIPRTWWVLAIYASKLQSLGFPRAFPSGSYHLLGGHAQCPSLEGFNLVPSRNSRKHCLLKCRLLTIQPVPFCCATDPQIHILFLMLRQTSGDTCQVLRMFLLELPLSLGFNERALREASSPPKAVCCV